MPSILKINGISKRFPGVQALRDVAFEVQQKSIHAVIGENGAGKSTLMQIIAGVHISLMREQLNFPERPSSSPTQRKPRQKVSPLFTRN